MEPELLRSHQDPDVVKFDVGSRLVAKVPSSTRVTTETAKFKWKKVENLKYQWFKDNLEDIHRTDRTYSNWDTDSPSSLDIKN